MCLMRSSGAIVRYRALLVMAAAAMGYSPVSWICRVGIGSMMRLDLRPTQLHVDMGAHWRGNHHQIKAGLFDVTHPQEMPANERSRVTLTQDIEEQAKMSLPAARSVMVLSGFHRRPGGIINKLRKIFNTPVKAIRLIRPSAGRLRPSKPTNLQNFFLALIQRTRKLNLNQLVF
jgi:hypothetical protein